MSARASGPIQVVMSTKLPSVSLGDFPLMLKLPMRMVKGSSSDPDGGALGGGGRGGGDDISNLTSPFPFIFEVFNSNVQSTSALTIFLLPALPRMIWVNLRDVSSL